MSYYDVTDQRLDIDLAWALGLVPHSQRGWPHYYVWCDEAGFPMILADVVLSSPGWFASLTLPG